jgi:hypothetical protein
VESVGVVSGADEQGCGGVGSDAEDGQQSRGVGADEAVSSGLDAFDLLVEVGDAGGELTQGELGDRGDVVAVAGAVALAG